MPKLKDEDARGSRSQSTSDRFVDSALELIARGEGLLDLGLGRTAVAKEANFSPRSYDYHFGPDSDRDLRAELAKRLDAYVVGLAQRSHDGYDQAARHLRDAARQGVLRQVGRVAVRQAILGDLIEPGPLERLFYLMLALSDAPREAAGIDLAAHLRATHKRSQALYERIYVLFAEVSGREFIDGRARTQRAVNAYLEGVLLHRRYGMGASDDEVVDTAIRLFWATTRQRGKSAVDVDEELFGPGLGADRGRDVSARPSAYAAHTTAETYDAALNALVAAHETGHHDVIRHASLHAHSGSPARVGGPGPERLRDQMLEMLRDGWRLQRLVSLVDDQHLDGQLDVAQEFMQAAQDAGNGGGIVMRAVVGDLLPTLVPLIVGDAVACLGVDNAHSNIAERTIVLNGRDTVAVLLAHFDELWHDRRALRIWDASGPVDDGITAARRALERRRTPGE